MSLTAALSAASTPADGGNNGNERGLADPRKGLRDFYTQFVISSALGLTAFLSFCVCFERLSSDLFSPSLILIYADAIVPPPEMDGFVRCAPSTTRRSVAATGATSYLLRLDTGSLQDYGR